MSTAIEKAKEVAAFIAGERDGEGCLFSHRFLLGTELNETFGH